MRRVERRRLRRAKCPGPLLQGVAPTAAALAAGDARRAAQRTAKALGAGAALAERVAKLEADPTGCWRRPDHPSRLPVRKAPRRAT